ncbi:replication initiator [Streptomyces spectabilis]|uniref:replication initiator n=1 Tax=Streptomyces spectabilis TaxID=68270 RepID=UPI0039A476A7
MRQPPCASRCPACAWTYAGDTYPLIRAGLVGDTRHGIPAAIRNRPRVFATLTAPSFGPVHNQPTRGTCRCGAAHRDDDPDLGTRSIRQRTTTPAPCCSTTRRATCGTASSTGRAARSPPTSASHSGSSKRLPGCRTARSPSSKSAEPSTSMP